MTAVGEEHARQSVARELHVDFPSVSVEQASVLVECLWSHFDGAPVRDFVPALVMKQAREELLEHLGPGAEGIPRRVEHFIFWG